MTCSMMVLCLGVWMSIQFGSQLNTAAAIKIPVSLQAYLGSIAGWPESSQPGPDPTDAIDFATDHTRRLGRLEHNIIASDVLIKPNTPLQGQLIESGQAGPSEDWLDVWERSKDAALANTAAQYLARGTCSRANPKRDACLRFIASAALPSTDLGKRCQERRGETTLICPPDAKYRSADGSCNHAASADALQRTWGRVHTAYRRLLPADYLDGIATVSSILPNPRYISYNLAGNATLPEPARTLSLAFWSQFVAHDMTQTPFSRMFNYGNNVACCRSDGGSLSPRHHHPSCMAMDLTDHLPNGERNQQYWKGEVRCIHYARSAPAMRPDCRLGPLEQMNAATHYLDGSAVYGSTAARTRALREGNGGRLKVQVKGGNEKGFLPASSSPTEACQVDSDTEVCYHAGDSRVNQHPHLAALHTVWVRQHNRLAAQLAALHPQWDDERLFQEARRVVVAQIQHVTYKEWLPLLLGKTYIKKMNLEVRNSGFSKQFDTNVDPSVTNSFATAAMRFVHSLVDGELRLIAENRSVAARHELHKHFNRPQLVESEDGLDNLLRGMATQEAHRRDLHFSHSVLKNLFRNDGSYGLDVLSLDIQRGRDHGLPGYNAFRERCGLPKVTDFSGFADYMPQEVVSKLRELYSSPDEVDLVVGGLAEHPASDDALLGPTFRCIVAEQMGRTRRGDAFFYDLSGRQSSFTADQLCEIRKTSLARILCDNSDGVQQIQADVFHKPSESNPLKQCTDTEAIPQLDLSAWKEDENIV
ncbi:peroxidase-like [Schistocerca cancellata]|uniref:peroxidase-like n=1 Tax=Schistocerca cancellata TaxID=274614 RepID=UPI00211899CC|nr:peroxidase-like [Schistocerca cancellata]